MDPPSALTVFGYALLTAIATGLGALPFLFSKQFSRRYLGLAGAAAAGLMLAASFGLIYQGVNYGLGRVVAGVLLGLVFIVVSHKFMGRYHQFSLGNLNGLDARKALILVGVMTLHSFAEGVGVGVAAASGVAVMLPPKQGLLLLLLPPPPPPLPPPWTQAQRAL
ncbi:MAG: hypothetical protein M1157_04925 [Deinococcus sp.]|nr:hypothetical protein [Deinococcus sp.]